MSDRDAFPISIHSIHVHMSPSLVLFSDSDCVLMFSVVWTRISCLCSCVCVLCFCLLTCTLWYVSVEDWWCLSKWWGSKEMWSLPESLAQSATGCLEMLQPSLNAFIHVSIYSSFSFLSQFLFCLSAMSWVMCLCCILNSYVGRSNYGVLWIGCVWYCWFNAYACCYLD